MQIEFKTAGEVMLILEKIDSNSKAIKRARRVLIQ
jgi:hypothetical protein